MSIQDLFERHDGEYLKFERVQNKLSNRPDLHAFLLLDRIWPTGRDMVCAAEHDEIFLDVEPDDLEKSATEDQIVELIRCGVRLDSSTGSLAMFV